MDPNPSFFPHFQTPNLQSQLGFPSMEQYSIPNPNNGFPLMVPKKEEPIEYDRPDWLNLHSLDAPNLQTADPIVQSHQPSSSSFAAGLPKPRSRSSEEASRRRKTITEKTRSLARLLPWDKKMHTEVILGEAYKYIKFLQAQVSVLQGMPDQSWMAESGVDGMGEFGGLEKLNRQQLLQVLVSSPAAQAVMSSEGTCVYSLEQLVWLEKILSERMEFEGSSSSTHP